MAFSSLVNSWTQWFQNNRPGNVGAGSGTPGTALVSDLQAEDYVVGARVRIVSTGATTSGVRSLTVERAGFQFTVGWVAASTVVIIRP